MSNTLSKPALDVNGLMASYDESQVLHGINLELGHSEIVSLLGRNGAGKSTTLKAIMGMLPNRTGSVLVDGAETIKLPAQGIARQGVAYCPEDRGIFATLTVYENLMLPPVLNKGGMEVQEIFDLFPNLYERRNSPGTKLSGGEQQMLAIARILRTGSRILLLDEPTEGLAPVIVQEIRRLIRRLREQKYSILLVEQNYRFAASVADRHYILESGQIVDHVASHDIERRKDDIKNYLGV